MHGPARVGKSPASHGAGDRTPGNLSVQQLMREPEQGNPGEGLRCSQRCFDPGKTGSLVRFDHGNLRQFPVKPGVLCGLGAFGFGIVTDEHE